MRNLLISFFLVLAAGTSEGKIPDTQYVFKDQIFDNRIKTVQLYREAWNLSYPIINLNSGEKLILKFDLLSDNSEDFYYSIIHYDKDWIKSDIFLNDYLEGFEENPVEDYRPSFNTTVHYYHYNLPLPNDRISFKVSGNYAVIIYPSGQKDKPALIHRFVISDESVKVQISTHRPLMTKENDTHQQVDFTVDYGGLNLNDPYRNVFACILQNGRWDNARYNLKPDFYGNNQLKYNSLSEKNIFTGKNEFRYFDIKSIRYKSEYVRRIDYATPYYNVYLEPSQDREFKPYFYWKDFNGKYYIAYQEGKDADVDADYVYVYFSLPASRLEGSGKVYVSGALTNWQCDKNNEMLWDDVRKEYECSILLKQGWYNYVYDALGDSDPFIFEGSHYETENDYVVLIYYRNPRERYDRVIGTAIANTLNKMSD